MCPKPSAAAFPIIIPYPQDMVTTPFKRREAFQRSRTWRGAPNPAKQDGPAQPVRCGVVIPYQPAWGTYSPMRILFMTISWTGLPSSPAWLAAMASTTAIPSITCPNTVSVLSR